jgi:hypothetical protein
MNIDHGVRNSIYRTGRAAALRAHLTLFKPCSFSSVTLSRVAQKEITLG